MMTHRSPLHSQDGFSLFATILFMLLVGSFASASLIYTATDLKSTSHYVTGNQAFAGAESGIIHALSRINRTGVMNFQNDVVQRWDQVFGDGWRSMIGEANVRYQVTVAADTAATATRGQLTATGEGPYGAERAVRVRLRKSPIVGTPGAVYLPNEQVGALFIGNSFYVNGNDHFANGDLNPDRLPKPGIATISDGATSAINGGLAGQQRDNVVGLGYQEGSSPDLASPSIVTSEGPSMAEINTMVAAILQNPSSTQNPPLAGYVYTSGTDQIDGNTVFGTINAPQITYLSSTAQIRLNGNASGAGILIVDGQLDILGTLDFVGLLIGRGGITINGGNSSILGSLWSTGALYGIGGNATVSYSSEALSLADSIGLLNPGNNLPHPMVITTWADV